MTPVMGRRVVWLGAVISADRAAVIAKIPYVRRGWLEIPIQCED